MVALTTAIPNLPVATSIDGSEYGVLVQGSTTKRFAVGLVMAASASSSVQAANTVLAGPTSGADAAPTFRALTSADFTGVVWAVSEGGTGISSYTAGDLIYASATTTLSKLAAGTSGYALVSGGAGTAPSWATVGTGGITDSAVTLAKIQDVAGFTVLAKVGTGTGVLAQVTATAANQVLRVSSDASAIGWGAVNLADGTNAVTGALAATNGGTGQTSYTVGDILYAGTTTTLSTLAASTSGYVLTSNGAGVAPSYGTIGTSSIAANAVTLAKIQQVNGFTILAKADTGTGDLTQLTASAANQVLRINAAGSAIEWGAINLADGTNAVTGTLPVTNGGTGVATLTTAYGLLAAGTTATGAVQTLAAGATTEILVGGGASALPAWTTATGSGAPVRATSPTLSAPTVSNYIRPSSNGGASIGVSGTAFSDLFLASGGVINWATSDMLITHASGYLAMTGGQVSIGAAPISNLIFSVTGSDASFLFGAAGTSKGFRVQTDTNYVYFQGVDNTLVSSFQPIVFDGSQVNFAIANTIKGGIDANANFVFGTAALATTATNGFVYIPTCAGAPTGTPTSKTGMVPMIYDTSGEALYIYNGGWVSVTLA